MVSNSKLNTCTYLAQGTLYKISNAIEQAAAFFFFRKAYTVHIFVKENWNILTPWHNSWFSCLLKKKGLSSIWSSDLFFVVFLNFVCFLWVTPTEQKSKDVVYFKGVISVYHIHSIDKEYYWKVGRPLSRVGHHTLRQNIRPSQVHSSKDAELEREWGFWEASRLYLAWRCDLGKVISLALSFQICKVGMPAA